MRTPYFQSTYFNLQQDSYNPSNPNYPSSMFPSIYKHMKSIVLYLSKY